MKNIVLALSVFISGAAVMILEITGARLLAPSLGTSFIVWTSLIGIILGALSLGYFLGGRLSDRFPSFTLFAILIFSSGLSVALLYLLQGPVLKIVINQPLQSASIFAVSVLFVLPSILFGTISPFAIRLAMHDIEHAGHVAGNLYAWSTVGSIVGTFAAGFWLLPLLGTHQIILWLSYVLMGYAILLLWYKRQQKLSCILLACLVVMILWHQYVQPQKEANQIAQWESQYNSIAVYEIGNTHKPIRLLKTGTIFQAAKAMDSHELVFPYTRYYRLDQIIHDDIQKRLVLGGGGYTIVEDIFQRDPDAFVDVVELDPEMTEVAKAYFGLQDRENLRIFHEDARTFLNTKSDTYDVIFMDTFLQRLSIPFHLTTKETAQLLSDHLNEDGIVMINVISALKGDNAWFLSSYYKTLKEVFGHVQIYKTQPNLADDVYMNLFIIAYKSQEIPSLEALKTKSAGLFDQFLGGFVSDLDFHDESMILTDDFAPIEYYITSTH